MTKKKDSLLSDLQGRLAKLKKPVATSGVLGQVVGYSHSRDILSVTDVDDQVVELIPLSETRASLKIALDHPTSGETLHFWVPMPEEVMDFYASNRIKVARSVGHLSKELSASLKGVKDDHDKAVDIVERSSKAKVRKTSKKKSRK